MSETKHTPLPWKAGTRERGRFCIYTDGGHGRGICVMTNIQSRDPDHEMNLIADANRDLIVRAVNAYEPMRAALKLALQCVARAEVEGAFNNCAAPLVGKSCIDQIEYALALTEKG